MIKLTQTQFRIINCCWRKEEKKTLKTNKITHKFFDWKDLHVIYAKRICNRTWFGTKTEGFSKYQIEFSRNFCIFYIEIICFSF